MCRGSEELFSRAVQDFCVQRFSDPLIYAVYHERIDDQ